MTSHPAAGGGTRPAVYTGEDDIEAMSVGAIAAVTSNYIDASDAGSDIYERDAHFTEHDLLEQMDAMPHPGAPGHHRAPSRFGGSRGPHNPSAGPGGGGGGGGGHLRVLPPGEVDETALIRELQAEEAKLESRRIAAGGGGGGGGGGPLQPLPRNHSPAAGRGGARQKRKVPAPGSGVAPAGAMTGPISAGDADGGVPLSMAESSATEQGFTVTRVVPQKRRGQQLAVPLLEQGGRMTFGSDGGGGAEMVTGAAAGDLYFTSLVECDEQARTLATEVERFKLLNTAKVPIEAVEQLMVCYEYLRGQHDQSATTVMAGERQRELLVLEMERLKRANEEMMRSTSEHAQQHQFEALQAAHDEELQKLHERLEGFEGHVRGYEERDTGRRDAERKTANILQVCEDVLRASKETSQQLDAERRQLILALEHKDGEMEQLHSLVLETRRSMQTAQQAGQEMVNEKNEELHRVMQQLEASEVRAASLEASGQTSADLIDELRSKLEQFEHMLGDREATVAAMREELTKMELDLQSGGNTARVMEATAQGAIDGLNKRYAKLGSKAAGALSQVAARSATRSYAFTPPHSCLSPSHAYNHPIPPLTGSSCLGKSGQPSNEPKGCSATSMSASKRTWYVAHTHTLSLSLSLNIFLLPPNSKRRGKSRTATAALRSGCRLHWTRSSGIGRASGTPCARRCRRCSSSWTASAPS